MKSWFFKGLPGAGLAVALGVMSGAAPAQELAPSYKLTLGMYRYADDTGRDVNLRWHRADLNAWVGAYRDQSFGTQWRAGLDDSVALNDWAQLQPSLQVASQGFVGGSVNLQVGQSWYGLTGWGRTNARPYANLNFDPNDAITLGGGWRDEAGRNLSLTAIRDDRFHTGQRHIHATLRWPLPEGERLTLDVLRKQGQGDDGWVRAWGWSVGYDFPSWFVRLARDPKQNFGSQDATRLSTGVRF